MTGLLLVLIAVALIASQFVGLPHYQLGFWLVVGSVICVLVLVASLVNLRFGVSFLLPIAVLYAMWTPQAGWPVINIWILLLAALVAGIGIDAITKSFRWNKWQKKFREAWNGDGDGDCNGGNFDHYDHAAHKARKAYQKMQYKQQKGRWAYQSGDSQNTAGAYAHNGQDSSGGLHLEDSGDDDHPVSRVHMGNNSRYLHSEALSSGLFEVSFGKLEVFFDQAHLAPEGAKIFVRSNFGELRLYIPANWSIETKGVSVTFANAPHISAAGNEGPVLTIEGNVSFGNLAIERIAPQSPAQAPSE